MGEVGEGVERRVEVKKRQSVGELWEKRQRQDGK